MFPWPVNGELKLFEKKLGELTARGEFNFELFFKIDFGRGCNGEEVMIDSLLSLISFTSFESGFDSSIGSALILEVVSSISGESKSRLGEKSGISKISQIFSEEVGSNGSARNEEKSVVRMEFKELDKDNVVGTTELSTSGLESTKIEFVVETWSEDGGCCGLSNESPTRCCLILIK